MHSYGYRLSPKRLVLLVSRNRNMAIKMAKMRESIMEEQDELISYTNT